MYKTINPANAEVLAEFPVLTKEAIDLAIHKADQAYGKHWRNKPLGEKIEGIRKVARQLRTKLPVYATQITTEMGKPIAQSRAEIEKCAWLCDFYADNAEAFLEPEYIEVGNDTCYVRYDPLGAVFGIMPWNFPFWQLMRYCVPALLEGNVILLKPASNVPQCGIELERLFQDTLDIEGVFQCLLLDTDDVERVVGSEIVQGVTLTGSNRAGSAVASLAGKHLKKSVMELGGSDPFIVLDDADLENAADAYVNSRMNNNGQTCIAAKRCLVQSNVYDPFLKLVKEKISKMKVGDPLVRDTDISCLSRAEIVTEVQDQVDRSLELGADIILDGGRENGSNYFKPMILTNVSHGMPVFEEEVFGPVAVVKPFETDENAIQVANASQYGLGCSIWSKNLERAQAMAVAVEAGSIHINKLVSSDPRVPFGGVKHSGYGRELGKQGMHEWVNIKSVTIDNSSG